jgi:integrase
MRGSIIERYEGTYSLVVDLGRDASGKRRQKWHTFRPTLGTPKREAKKQTEAKLAELLSQVDKGTYVAPSKMALIDYLRDWHAKAVAPNRRPETVRVYKVVIERHVAKSAIAGVPLQRLRATDLEAYYATLKAKPSTVTVHHAVLGRALKMAVRDGLIVANPATAADDRPRPSKDRAQAARESCLSVDEARRVLAAASETSTQVHAFLSFALDSGARKSELLALRWSDFDPETARLTIDRQLDEAGPTPVYGPTKTKYPRTIRLNDDTVARLRAHRRSQSAIKMANRTTYADHGLMFAMEPEDLQTPRAALGLPCEALTTRWCRRVLKAAGVRRLKFHSTRHTSATLLLASGVAVQTVAERVGHLQITTTLSTYAHVTPDAQGDAAARLGAVLAGRLTS